MPLRLALSEGSTIADMVAVLKLPPDVVRPSFVTGEKLSLDSVLREGDLASLFSALVGG